MVVMRTVNVGLVGETGRSGKEAKKLLLKHPIVELVYSSSSSKNKGDLRDADVVFLATPSEVSREKVPALLRENRVVIDFSRAYRLSGNAVYGLPEKNRDRIRAARLISNPGCYATSIMLGLLPIVESVESVRAVCVSGISGAGAHPSGEGGLRGYMVGWKHDHIKEMERELGLTGMAFTPIVAECLDRGIVSAVNVVLKRRINVRKALEKYYSHEWFVRIKDEAGTKALIGTNYCDISVSQHGREAVIVSALDNLMKGAAGQAVQNMNIICGFDEMIGLTDLP
ncbi:hypothetical protein H0O00_04795 [Candidatus Micrarchaeota archaeon]|nr:hypothetical protein [Candidatus Micrarchaeota archaeon]